MPHAVDQHGQMAGVSTTSDTGEQSDRLAIRDLLDNWAMWRDTGQAERLATLFHDDGWMITTWQRGPARNFVEASRQPWRQGLISIHMTGAATIAIRGNRAVAQSRMSIFQRAPLDGIEVDVTCYGRFWDALEKREGRWGFVLRHPIYDVDRIAPVEPSQVLTLDSDLLNAFPIGYRHLAYLQTRQGRSIDTGLPGGDGPALDALLAREEPWLAGAPREYLGLPD